MDSPTQQKQFKSTLQININHGNLRPKQSVMVGTLTILLQQELGRIKRKNWRKIKNRKESLSITQHVISDLRYPY